MMKNNQKVANQLIMMIMVTVVTQVFILLKNSLLAANFGVSVEIDAFNFTTNISNFVYSFIGAGISTVLMPYLKLKSNKRSIDIFITVIYSLAIVLAVVMILFRGPIIQLLSGESETRFFDIASNILFFTIITGFLNSFVTLCSSVLEFNGYFIRQKLTILVTAILMVLFLLLPTDMTIYYYAAVTSFIALFSAAVHIFFLKKTDFTYQVNFDVNDKMFQEMGTLMLPTVLSTGVYQLSVLVDSLIAARLPVGSISILNYANSVVSMFNMLILANLTSYFYPRLVKKDTVEESQKSLADYLLIINALLFLIVAVFLLIGKEGIGILYQRGNFTPEDTQIVYLSAIVYMLALPINGSRDLIYKYFYIQRNTKSPFLNSILVSFLNLVISIVLAQFIGLSGVVIGTVVASYISLYAISKKFKKAFDIHFDFPEFAKEISKIIGATIFTLVITMMIKSFLTFQNPFVIIILMGILATSFFVGTLWILKSKVFRIEL